MGDLNASDCSWKKIVIAKTNNKWISKMKCESDDSDDPENLTISEDDITRTIKQEIDDSSNNIIYSEKESTEPSASFTERDPLRIKIPESRRVEELISPSAVALKRKQRKKSSPKDETPDGRAARLARMSAYAARRLANESPEQRAARLKRMSEYAARRLSQESAEQRARRLARMSAYAAQRLANESPEQRNARLSRMSAYAARRQAMRKNDNSDISHEHDLSNIMSFIPHQS